MRLPLTPRARKAFTLVELLVVVAIIGILVGLLLPAVQQAREAARRAECQNNMKQIGIALLMFHDSNRVFPASGWTTAGPGNPAGKFVGWRPLVLPYLEQKNLHALYDFKINWWEGSNQAAAGVIIPTFRCPSTASRIEVYSAIAKSPRPAMQFSTPLAPTDYEAIMGVQPSSINPVLYNASNRFAVLHRNSRVKIAAITDGTSSTVMIGEAAGRPTVFRVRTMRSDLANDQGIGWADSEGPFSLDGSNGTGSLEGCGPSNGCTSSMNKRNDNEPYSFHTGGAMFLFADGHVEFLSEGTELATMAALCTRAAGEITASLE